MFAMKNVLQLLKNNEPIDGDILNFDEIKETIGFNKYYRIASQYNSLNQNKK